MENAMSSRNELIEMISRPDVFDRRIENIDDLQLDAARELFATRRAQISVLRRRAAEAGIGEIASLRDLVPLLFAHTSYKSYPSSFLEARRWDRMLQWLQTLSTQDVSGVDIDGVREVDDWIDRLRAAGHMVLATSGTSGKVSFLNHTRGDGELKRLSYRRISGWPWLRPDNSRPVFIAGPSKGANSAVEASHNAVAVWARDGDAHFLTDEPLLLGEVSRMVALRHRIGRGEASPSEIEAAEREAADKSTRMGACFDAFVEKLLARRHEPIVLTALWAQHLMIIERARRMGVKDGDFHPSSLISAGGGVKGVQLPPDYKEQVHRFYGNVVRGGAYGMTELASLMPRCEQMRYHRPPTLIWLLLDQNGERLLSAAESADGVMEGRFAFLDLIYEGRWGGIITGDKVQVDFADTCPCGRPGPTILDTITRYSQPGQDDHIGCAGTIDSYIRGAIAA
jgi:hypothetical protein